MKTAITKVEGAPKPVGAYSPAVVYNGVIYCAGQIGIDSETGQLVSGGVEAQARRVMDNLKAVLSACSALPSDILMTSIFLVNIADAKVVNEIYSQFVCGNGDSVNSQNFPARQTVAVKELPLGALVEISLIAASKE